ncbi:hypothetical protein BVY04_04985 [bacterium M21]|nr:hypothetical protein BVY04_04985 [bacterium M21]
MSDNSSDARTGKKVWLIPVVLVVCCVILMVIQKMAVPVVPTKAEVPPQNVGVQTLKTQLYEEVIYLPGKITADIDVTVSSELAGTLDAWLVDEGASVTKGQVIAQLNTDLLTAKLVELTSAMESAKAGLNAAEQGLELAKLGKNTAEQQKASAGNSVTSAKSSETLARLDLERTKRLQREKVRSQADMERDEHALIQAQMNVANAKENQNMATVGIARAQVQQEQAKAEIAINQARIAELKAAMNSIQVSLDKSAIKAPLTGVIDDFLVEAGETVSPGMPLVKAYKLDFVRVLAHISDRYAPFLEQANPVVDAYIRQNMPGAVQKVACSLMIQGLPKLGGKRDLGVELPATLARTAKAASGMSNTFEVELRLANPGGALKQGMIVRSKIKFVEYPEALVIPMSAIRVTDQGAKCLVVEQGPEGATASVRTIDPKSVNKDNILVNGNLKAGELLIISGVKGILNGEKVKIIQQDGKTVEVQRSKAVDEKLGKK